MCVDKVIIAVRSINSIGMSSVKVGHQVKQGFNDQFPSGDNHIKIFLLDIIKMVVVKLQHLNNLSKHIDNQIEFFSYK